MFDVMKFFRGSAVYKAGKRYFRNERGAVIAVFAIMAPVVIGTAGAAMDISQAYLVRQRLGNALDASTLAAAAAFTNEEDIEARVEAFFEQNYPETAVGEPYGLEVTVDGEDVTVSARAEYTTSFLGVLGIKKINVYRETKVQRLLGHDIEVALVVDISGSMNNPSRDAEVGEDADDVPTKVEALQEAAHRLVNTLVYNNQDDHYSKMAIIPYGNAVNVGSYAAELRGAMTANTSRAITGITRANPGVVTSNNHGFANDSYVYITGVNGMTQINNLAFQVKNRTTNTFQLRPVTNPGGSNLNTSGYSAYTNGGSAIVPSTTAGAQYFRFSNASGTTQQRVHVMSTCVTERVGANAYTDVTPAGAATYLGRHYPPLSTPCVASEIVPLTNDKDTLHDAIDGLAAGGSTGGQVGVEWAWYILAPNFGDFWDDADSAPADYGTEQLDKIVILMTDGEYNSPHYNGVIARDATSGSGSAADHITNNASNGNAYTQARRMCDEMKENDSPGDPNIEVYTIGFRVDQYPDGESLMQYCATNEDTHYFAADDGEELQDAFEAIAKDISTIFLAQ